VVKLFLLFLAELLESGILKNGISRMILPGANQAEEDDSNQISL